MGDAFYALIFLYLFGVHVFQMQYHFDFHTIFLVVCSNKNFIDIERRVETNILYPILVLQLCWKQYNMHRCYNCQFEYMR